MASDSAKPKAVTKARDGAIKSGRGRKAKNTEKADWSKISDETLGAFVRLMVSKGDAVRIGYTRDQGAFAVGVYVDGESDTEYIRPQEDLVAELEEILVAWHDIDTVLGDRL